MKAIKERVFRISDFARVQYYRWCVDPRQFRLEKQKEVLGYTTVPPAYRKSIREFFYNFLYYMRRIVTNRREYRCIDIFPRWHKRNRNFVKERNKRKKEKGRERADGRNTFSSLRIKRKDDQRRDSDYTSRAKGRPCSSPLFQLSIGHRRKLHVAFPCVTMHAGYNRITLLLCHQEDHYAQPGARRRSERNCIV